MNYCPRCGHPLTDRIFEGKSRRACDSCGFIYFRDPKVGVAVFVTRGDEVLLVKRGVQPGLGKWALPAGYVDYGEDPREAAVREVEEETGLRVAVGKLIDVLTGSSLGRGASIVIFYSACPLNGTLAPGSDVDETAFFAANDLPELAFANTRQVIDRWLADREER